MGPGTIPEAMNETIVLEKDRTIWWRPDWKWSGKNCSAAKFDARAQDELQEQGGRSYSKFYTGDYGGNQFEEFLHKVFNGVWHHPKLEDASFDGPAAEG